MKVIRLRYRDQAQAIHRILDLVRPLGDKVERESEEVLTVWIAPNGAIRGIAPPPRGVLNAGVELADCTAECDQVIEDAAEHLHELLRGPLDTHGVI